MLFTDVGTECQSFENFKQCATKLFERTDWPQTRSIFLFPQLENMKILLTVLSLVLCGTVINMQLVTYDLVCRNYALLQWKVFKSKYVCVNYTDCCKFKCQGGGSLLLPDGTKVTNFQRIRCVYDGKNGFENGRTYCIC